MVQTTVIATRPVPGGKALGSARLLRHDASAAAQGCAHTRHGQPVCPETSHTRKHTQAEQAAWPETLSRWCCKAKPWQLAACVGDGRQHILLPCLSCYTKRHNRYQCHEVWMCERSSNKPAHQESQNPSKQCSMTSSMRPQRLSQHRHSAVQQMLALPPQCCSHV